MKGSRQRSIFRRTFRSSSSDRVESSSHSPGEMSDPFFSKTFIVFVSISACMWWVDESPCSIFACYIFVNTRSIVEAEIWSLSGELRIGRYRATIRQPSNQDQRRNLALSTHSLIATTASLATDHAPDSRAWQRRQSYAMQPGYTVEQRIL